MSEAKRVEVAVGVIVRDGLVFLTKRADNVHQGGKWEFPGGKKEADESITEALARELFEEVDIQVINAKGLLDIQHDYPDKSVFLGVYLVEGFSGEPRSKEGLISRWVPLAELPEVDFPEANKPIVAAVMRTLQR